MKILICGASGFVGEHLANALQSAGHTIVRGVRRPTTANDLAIDYRHDINPEVWRPRLAGIDGVINAIGLLRDTPRGVMRAVHGLAPQALFQACAHPDSSVQWVINVSALGMGESTGVYFDTRKPAEDTLFALPARKRWLNLRPSIIDGDGGKSAEQFRAFARMPLLLLPHWPHFFAQPVHIHDIAKAALRWIDNPNLPNQTLICAGAETTTLQALIASYREQMGKAPARVILVPTWMTTLAAKIGDFLPFSPLATDTVKMMEQPNVGDNRALTEILGQLPLSFRTFLSQCGYYHAHSEQRS